MKHLWFKAKRFGWGWCPATWEGWLVLLGFLVFVIGNVYRLRGASAATGRVPVELLIETAILLAVLLWICWKTGERPRWRWGK